MDLNKEKKMKAAIYTRVSTDEQAQNCTIENQVRTSKEFLKNNKSYEVYDYYKDDGITGRVPLEDRPEGARLLKDASDKKFDVVLVTSTDRFGRRLKVLIDAVETLTEKRVAFRSMSEPYNTDTPIGKLMFNLLSSFAEFELEHIIVRSKVGKERAIDEGRWVGGLPPYGYVVNEETKKLALYKDKILLGKYSEVDVIKKIYDLCANSRLTSYKIAERLNQEKIPPYTKEKNKQCRQKKAKYWRGERVRNLIKEPIYKGENIIGRRSNGTIKSCKKKVVAIVTEEVWEQAQMVLESNIILATRNARNDYLLSGKPICPECKRSLSGHNDHGILYYVCNNNRFKNNKDPYKCHNKAIRADVLEEEVWKDIKSMIENPELIRSFLEKRLETISKVDPSKVIEKAQKELRNIERQKQNLVRNIRFCNGYLEDNIEIEIEGLKKREEIQLKIIADHQDKDKQMKKEKHEISLIEQALIGMIDKIKNPEFKVKKQIINILLDKVIVYPSKSNKDERRVEIYYRFKENPSSTDISTWTAL